MNTAANISMFQQTKALFLSGDHDAAYIIFLADESGNGCSFSEFARHMQRIVDDCINA